MQTRVVNKKQTGFFDNFGPERWRNHMILLGLSLVGVAAAYAYEPSALLTDIIALGTGYVALVFLVVTLSIGPLNLILKRKNGVNLDLRRDVGIWTGITATVHAVFSFLLYSNANVLLYFFDKKGDNLTPQFNLFGLSNVLGVLAEIIMLVLLLLSNNLSLRLLKGKRWKFFQRFNYPLFILTVAHTIGYQVLNTHTGFFNFILIALVFFTVEAQLVGVILTLTRERKREATSKVAPATLSTAEVEQNTIARRRFLVLSGVTVVSGIGSIVALSAAISNQNQSNNVQAQASSNSVASGATNSNNSNTGSASDNGSVASTAGSDNSTSASAGSSTGSSDTAAPATGDGSTTNNGSSGNSSSSSSNGGTVLATLSSLPVGACTTYNTPDSGDSAFLIHEKDGSVKSFSNMCTHRPYPLTYEQSQQVFYCPLHGAAFDVTSGDVLSGPARYGLQPFKVQVNSQGQVVYTQQS